MAASSRWKRILAGTGLLPSESGASRRYWSRLQSLRRCVERRNQGKEQSSLLFDQTSHRFSWIGRSGLRGFLLVFQVDVLLLMALISIEYSPFCMRET